MSSMTKRDMENSNLRLESIISPKIFMFFSYHRAFGTFNKNRIIYNLSYAELKYLHFILTETQRIMFTPIPHFFSNQ